MAVGDILPVLPGVFSFPDAAGAGAEIECAKFAGMAGDGDDASAAEGADAAPASDVFEGRVHVVWAFRW